MSGGGGALQHDRCLSCPGLKPLDSLTDQQHFVSTVHDSQAACGTRNVRQEPAIIHGFYQVRYETSEEH